MTFFKVVPSKLTARKRTNIDFSKAMKKVAHSGKGWFGEHGRHSLVKQGIGLKKGLPYKKHGNKIRFFIKEGKRTRSKISAFGKNFLNSAKSRAAFSASPFADDHSVERAYRLTGAARRIRQDPYEGDYEAYTSIVAAAKERGDDEALAFSMAKLEGMKQHNPRRFAQVERKSAEQELLRKFGTGRYDALRH